MRGLGCEEIANALEKLWIKTRRGGRREKQGGEGQDEREEGFAPNTTTST